MRAWGADGSSLTEVADRVAWISGRSSAAHAALAPAQQVLIARAVPFGFVPVTTGFPFRPDEGAWTKAGLISASVRNGVQYAALRWHRPTLGQVAARLEPLLRLTRDRLLVVCGSLGLELFVRGLRAQGKPSCLIRIVALGPVCAAPVDGLDLRVAQAPTDVLSRLHYAGPVQIRPRCRHLDYVHHREVADLVTHAAKDPW